MFNPIIKSHDSVLFLRPDFSITQYINNSFVPAISFFAGYVFDDVPSHKAGILLQFFHQIRNTKFGRRNNAFHRPGGSDVFYKRSCVDTFEADNVIGF